MKIVGVIAEYNPLHKGHAYHLEQARRMSGADYCIVAMSGYFVQRGEPAIMDPAARCRAALLLGADMVVQIPEIFSCAAAPDFAAAGVHLLLALGCDTLAFGSECGDAGALMEKAWMALREDGGQFAWLQDKLKKGKSYASSMADALGLTGSNDILALEYCKAILLSGSAMQPLAVQRSGADYNQEEAGEGFASASALRRLLLKGDFEGAYRQMPDDGADICREQFAKYAPVSPDDLSDMLFLALREAGELSAIAGISPSLADRLDRHRGEPSTFTELVGSLRARNFTESSVRRALLHVLLGCREENVRLFRENGHALYARLLGFRREAAPLLHAAKKASAIPLVAKAADAKQKLSPDAYAQFLYDVKAADIYRQAVYRRSGHRLPDPYRTGVVIR